MQTAGSVHALNNTQTGGLHWSVQVPIQAFLSGISEPVCNPVLSTFPLLLDQPDLLDALRVGDGLPVAARSTQ